MQIIRHFDTVKMGEFRSRSAVRIVQLSQAKPETGSPVELRDREPRLQQDGKPVQEERTGLRL